MAHSRRQLMPADASAARVTISQLMYQQIDKNLDRTLAHATELRQAISEPHLLAAEVDRVLEAVPLGCSALISYSEEGHAVAAACSAIAKLRGRHLRAEQASMLRPLSPNRKPAGWAWVSVEEALGFGPPRNWVVEWADARGGRPLALVGVRKKVA